PTVEYGPASLMGYELQGVLKMKSYQYYALILVITFSFLSLLSSPMVTRVRAGEDKTTPLVDQRNDVPALDANRHNSSIAGLLSERAALPALAVAGRPEPAAPSAMAGQTFTVNSTADPGNGVCDAAECTLREAIAAANAAAGSDTITFNIPNPGP